MSRRNLLKWMGASSATLALAACAPAAAPTGGSAAEGEAAPSGEKIQMSVATYAAVLHDWQREFSRRWAEENADDVDLQIEEVVYNEMAKLQLARSASGTLWDVTFSGIKWFPFSASKEMFISLDDYLASREDANLDDFFPAALEGGKLDGTLYGLPYEIHPGNPALVVFNIDMLEAKGLPLPTDDWDVNQYAQLASEATDAENGVFGTNYLPGNYYDFESLVRAFGGDIMDAERKQLLFATDELNREAAAWITSLRAELNAAPKRDEVEGLSFASELFATQVTGSYSVNPFATEIGDSFRHDWALFPKGPTGLRGYTAFTSNFSCSTDTASPEHAVDLLVYLTSTEAGTWSALEQGTGQPNARRSVWENEELLAQSHPIFQRVVDMFNNEEIPGPFPMPYNLRFQELQDNWANTSPDVFYGDLAFEEGMQNVQDAMQEILDLPRA